jgi:hypothetical protein
MERSEDFWKERLDKNVPEQWKKAIKRIYHAYPEEYFPNGLCDVMYILNTLAHELELGDGRGTFYEYETKGGKQNGNLQDSKILSGNEKK